MHKRERKLPLPFLMGIFVLGLAALTWALAAGSSGAHQGATHNCPLQGKWAIAVWAGDDGTDTGQALASCGQGAVTVAYSLDPQTQVWSRWFADRADISNLDALNNLQGVMALGGAGASATPTPSPTPTPTATPVPPAVGGAMGNCPVQGKWAISVWEGDDGTDTGQALATCGQGAVAVAYSIDPYTQVWSRWFADRADITNLDVLNNKQGVMALGGTGAGAPEAPGTTPSPTPTAPTATPTATPTGTPSTTEVGGPPTDYLQTFHATLDASMEMDSLEMDLGSEGDFEAPDSCSCDITGNVLGMLPIEQHIVVIGNKAWIDTGDGWRETTPSDLEVAQAVALCPSCAGFWEGYSLQQPLPPGEHETKNGVPAIHYSLAEYYEAFTGMGLIPEEMEGVSIDTLDVWLAEDGYWPVCLDLELCMDAEVIEEYAGTLPGVESVCATMNIEITQVNDPTIEVNPPQ